MLLEEEHLWGQRMSRVWLPKQDVIVCVPESDLQDLSDCFVVEKEELRIKYLTAAAKIAELLEGVNAVASDAAPILLAPMESNVIPLPHQIHALNRAVSNDRVRYLLADEVGLGKTVEAGLVMRELKLRGKVKRTLVVAPKSIAMQWVSEMESHFNETFVLVNPGDLEALERLNPFPEHGKEMSDNPWLKFPQTIVTLDAVKPLTRRRGWTKEKIQEYNKKRYESLIEGQWDLIIVDESHRIGGSTDRVARHKLGQGLAEAAPYLLLLSATPHQGKSDAFHRLMSLLDPMTFPDEKSLTRENVAEFVIRTEKRRAVTAEGEPLFKPRVTKINEIDLTKNQAQVALYDAVTEYAKEGYNKALKNHKPHIGLLMILLQRIVTSSTYAIRCTLERRLNVLHQLGKTRANVKEEDINELTDLDGQMQLDFLIEVDPIGKSGELNDVEYLLELAERAALAGHDVKADELLDLIYKLEFEEGEDNLKLLIFTEFVPTQEMLKQFLESRGISCATLNGSMSMEERKEAQREFRDRTRVLIATDAGGEGLNLQFCHVVVNYDLPWNPMRIEQRIGRVDRIGQAKTVKALNFVYKDSVEGRVREVLESKLAVILEELGIDKAHDILDSSLSGEAMENMITQVMMEGKNADEAVDETLSEIEQNLAKAHEECAVYGISDIPDLKTTDKLRRHPLPHWIERMTGAYLALQDCEVKKDLCGWNFSWPDGTVVKKGNFHVKELTGDGTLLSLETAQVEALTKNLEMYLPGQRMAKVMMSDLPSGLKGMWALFEICLSYNAHGVSHIQMPLSRRSFMPLFMNEDGRLYQPTGRHIWDRLLTNDATIISSLDAGESRDKVEEMMNGAKQLGADVFNGMRLAHFAAIEREEKRGATAFSAKSHVIGKIGLDEVKTYRLKKLAAEKAQWANELDRAKLIIPELRPIIMLSIEQG